jgi:hypothetical protein
MRGRRPRETGGAYVAPPVDFCPECNDEFFTLDAFDAAHPGYCSDACYFRGEARAVSNSVTGSITQPTPVRQEEYCTVCGNEVDLTGSGWKALDGDFWHAMCDDEEEDVDEDDDEGYYQVILVGGTSWSHKNATDPEVGTIGELLIHGEMNEVLALFAPGTWSQVVLVTGKSIDEA